MKYIEILKGLGQYDRLFNGNHFDEIDRWMVRIKDLINERNHSRPRE